LPEKTTVAVNGRTVTIEGPRGKLQQPLQPGIEVRVEDGVVTLHRAGSTGEERARHGLARALLANAVVGVTEGFRKELEIVGVGYRGQVKGREVHLALGYSHPVVYPVPDGVEVVIDERANRITVSGNDKQQVGQVAADLRSLRKPDAYKGKGIRYRDEELSRSRARSSRASREASRARREAARRRRPWVRPWPSAPGKKASARSSSTAAVSSTTAGSRRLPTARAREASSSDGPEAAREQRSEQWLGTRTVAIGVNRDWGTSSG